MSTRTNDSAFRDPLHEKLCAWILGEATADEAREVEAALENDPELRAERTRLEATIGVVQGAFPAQERLSGDAMVALANAAQAGARQSSPVGPKPVPARAPSSAWYRSGTFRAAAAMTIVLGGAVFALRAEDGYLGKWMQDEVARVSEPADSSLFTEADSAGRSDTLTTGIKQMGYSDGDAGDDKRPGERSLAEAGKDPSARAAGEPALKGLGYLGGDNDATSVATREVDAGRLQSRLSALQEGVTGDVPEVRDEVRLAPVTATHELARSVVPGAKSPAAESIAGSAAPSGPSTVGPTPPAEGTVRARGSLTGSDDFFLGHGKEDAFGQRKTESKTLNEAEKAQDSQAQESQVRSRRALGGELRQEVRESLNELGYGGDVDEEQEAAASGEAGSADGTVLERRAYKKDFDVEASVSEQYGEVDELLALAEELRTSGTLEGLDALGEDRGGRRHAVDRLLEVPRALDELRLDRRLSDDELVRLAELLQRRYLQDCRRRPQETPRDMYYRWWGDNPFEDTIRDAQSTFSVDVDTASYVLARRYLREGHLPVRAQVRTEEFLNYFTPDLAAPSEGTFAVHTELAPSRFGGPSERWMLRVGVRGKDVSKEERQPLAITFVVDTSGSMRENNRLEVVKHAIRLLVGQLDARDSIGLVAFSSEPRLILPMTSAAQRDLIESALHPLQPGGSTNAEGGLKMGYELARTALDPNVHSRVVFLSDGVANVGQTDQDRISQDVAVQRSQGIYLNTIGVGMNNHNDVFLEQLANKGDGICDYVDDADSARRAIVDRFTGAMIPIASDVKIQVEFDPSRVVRYRLLGYENRAIADKDFRNDAVDAGEVGAGHQVVALYELELGPERDGAPLATVRLRWKEPKATGQHPAEISVTETETAVHWEDAVAAFASASPGYRRSVLAAQLAEFLRRSSHAANDSFATLFEDARALALEVKEEESVELAELVGKTIELGLPMQLQRDAIETLIDEYRRQQILEARLDALERAKETERLREDLQRRNLELELRLQDLLLQELKRKNG